MKNAEEYIDVGELKFKSSLLMKNIVKKWINQAQRDAVDAAVKMCAEEASMDLYDFIGTGFKKFPQDNYYSINDGTYIDIDKQSILQVADKLKQEIG